MNPNPADLIKKFPTATIIIIGDVMLDKSISGGVNRVAPEAPVPVVHVSHEEYYLGGAANAAANVAALGGQAILIGYLGSDHPADIFKQLCMQQGITCRCIQTNQPTIRKIRVSSAGQQIVRVDYEEKPKSPDRTDIIHAVQEHLPKACAILLSDYNKGCITPDLVRWLVATGKPVLADPKPENLSMFSGIRLLQPNHHAVEKAMGQPLQTEEEVSRAGKELAQRLGSNLLITRAAHGMSLIETTGAVMHIPTQAREVFDVTGAGDSSIAAATLAIACGGTLRDAVILANQTAGIKVGKRGTATVSSRELSYELEAGHVKIKTLDEILWICQSIRSRGKTIVFTNGFFDPLHIGHAQLFQQAKHMGDCLIVGINTDTSIMRLKGAGRPYIPQHERAEILSAIGAIDFIVFFDDDTPLGLISQLSPDVLVKGGTYTPKDVVGFDTVQARGGRVEIIPVEQSQHRLGTSTSIEE